MQDTEREREGLAMVLAGLRQGLEWMGETSPSYRSLVPLMHDLEWRLAQDPLWPDLQQPEKRW